MFIEHEEVPRLIRCSAIRHINLLYEVCTKFIRPISAYELTKRFILFGCLFTIGVHDGFDYETARNCGRYYKKLPENM